MPMTQQDLLNLILNGPGTGLPVDPTRPIQADPNRGMGGTPLAAPTAAGAVQDERQMLLQKLGMAPQMEVPQAPKPWQNILAGLADALGTYGSIRYGGPPPQQSYLNSIQQLRQRREAIMARNAQATSEAERRVLEDKLRRLDVDAERKFEREQALIDSETKDRREFYKANLEYAKATDKAKADAAEKTAKSEAEAAKELRAARMDAARYRVAVPKDATVEDIAGLIARRPKDDTPPKPPTEGDNSQLEKMYEELTTIAHGDPDTPGSSLMERLRSGEMTLEQVQNQLEGRLKYSKLHPDNRALYVEAINSLVEPVLEQFAYEQAAQQAIQRGNEAGAPDRSADERRRRKKPAFKPVGEQARRPLDQR